MADFSRQQMAKAEIISESVKQRYYILKRVDQDQDLQNDLKPLLVKDRLVIFNEDKRVILDSYQQALDRVFGYEDMSQRVSQVRISQDGQRLLYTWTPMIRNQQTLGSVLLISDISSLYYQALSVIKGLSYVLIPFLFACGILFYLYTVRSLSPIEDIRDGVREMTRGNYGTKLEPKGLGEIQQISRSINELGQRLEQINRQQTLFVSNVSHELKTPVASIRILLDSILQEENMDEDLKNEFMRDISSETDRLRNILEDLLYIASLEKQDISLNLENRPLSRVIEESMDAVRILANKKNISLEFDPSEKIFIEIDFEKMKQVFINLLSNAVKYSDEDSTIRIFQIEGEEFIRVDVVDEGIGIDEKDLPFIFDRFYRVSGSRSRSSGGTGLGTSIAKEVVLLHQGEIFMKSKVGEGTTVTVKIPRKYQV